MKSRLPIDYPSAWQVSGVGRAYPWNYPHILASQFVIREESAGERGRQIYGLRSLSAKRIVTDEVAPRLLCLPIFTSSENL
jgi:hypothetical protein